MKELKNKVVHLKTQAEYDEYMQMCEDAGWLWGSGSKPKRFNQWKECGEDTCVRVEDKFGYADLECYEDGEYKIITLKELKELNNIKTKTFMTNIKEALKKLTLQEPNKTLHKAGLMDLDGNWNEEVRDFALEEMLNNYMATEDFKEKMLELAKANEANKKTK